MAELIRQDADDDGEDAEGSKRPNKPVIPKRLPELPIFMPPEKQPPPEEAKRIAEMLPGVIDKPKESFEADLEDDDDEAEEGAERTEQPAVEASEDAPNESVAESDIFELSEDMVHLRGPGPEAEGPAEIVSDGTEEAAETDDSATSTSTPAGTPPLQTPPPSLPKAEAAPPDKDIPRPPPPVSGSGFSPIPSPDRPPSYTPNTYSGQVPEQVSAEIRRASDKAEEDRKRTMRLVIVAGVATGLLLKSYIDGKARQLDAVKLGLDFVQDQLSTVFKQRNEKAAERPAAPVAEKSQPQPQPAVEVVPAEQIQEQIFDMEGNEITIQPGWHVERSSGGYSVVLDEHNRVVHDAIQYGEAFRRDKKREQLDDDVFNAVAGGGTSGGGPTGDDTAAAGPVAGQSGQHGTHAGQDFLAGMQERPPVDIEHRLPKPHANPLTALASPWLWMAIAILIIIYFVAALA